jgi:CheY-like chemotaxis protein
VRPRELLFVPHDHERSGTTRNHVSSSQKLRAENELRPATRCLRQELFGVGEVPRALGFTSGKEAVAALRGGHTSDVVITDFEMPVVDGAAVTRAARESSPTACIVVTNRGAANRSRLEDDGACLVLEKPIEYEVMHREITACRAVGGHAGPRCARLCPGVRGELAAIHRRR